MNVKFNHINLEKLKQLIEEGILTDLIKAEEAISVFKTISINAAQINSSEDTIKFTFGYIQQLSFNEFILSISRMYDKKTPRNSNRCIEAVIKYLFDYKDVLPPVREKYQLALHMRHFHMPEYLVDLIDNGDPSQFPAKLSLYYENRLMNLREGIKTIKVKRDKNLAHNEPTEVIRIKIDESEHFLNFGWKFVVIIGWAYLNSAYGFTDDFHLKRDSHSQGIYINRVIQKLLNIVA
jgi:hypothetical protein